MSIAGFRVLGIVGARGVNHSIKETLSPYRIAHSAHEVNLVHVVLIVQVLDAGKVA